jgi:hypothetical protein
MKISMNIINNIIDNTKIVWYDADRNGNQSNNFGWAGWTHRSYWPKAAISMRKLKGEL